MAVHKSTAAKKKGKKQARQPAGTGAAPGILGAAQPMYADGGAFGGTGGAGRAQADAAQGEGPGLLQSAAYLGEKWLGGTLKTGQTMWNGGIDLLGRPGAQAELLGQMADANKFAFLGGPWQAHAENMEQTAQGLLEALPQGAENMRTDEMSRYAGNIDARYGVQDGPLKQLGDRMDTWGAEAPALMLDMLYPGGGNIVRFTAAAEDAMARARAAGATEEEAYLLGIGGLFGNIAGEYGDSWFRDDANGARPGEQGADIYESLPEAPGEDIYESLPEAPGWDIYESQPEAPGEDIYESQPETPGSVPVENPDESVYDEDEGLLPSAGGYRGYADYRSYEQRLMLAPDVSMEEKVARLQQAYEATDDKTDIMVPRDARFIKGIGENGTIEYDWNPQMGFAPGYAPIGAGTQLPAQMDRYGHSGGSNFCAVPETGAYSYRKRALPYVYNPASYHTWNFNGGTYIAKIEAVRQKDLQGLNALLEQEGLPPVDQVWMADAIKAYERYLRNVENDMGQHFSAPYGVTGFVQPCFEEGTGGADQWWMPLSAGALEDIGILIS